MNPGDVPPKDVPEGVEPSAEEFHNAASELEPEPEHIALTAIKSGIAGFALAAGLLASAPGYMPSTAPPPTVISTTMKDLPSASLQAGPISGEGEPPDPSQSLLLHPRLTWTPQGTVAYDFGHTASNWYTNVLRPVLASAPPQQTAPAIADRFQDRVLAPSSLANVVDRLPDWSTPAMMLGSDAPDHGQLLEEPLDALLVLHSDLQQPSEAPRATEATRTEAKSYFTAFWSELSDKLIDPKTAADKVVDELFKLPEHLLALLGSSILLRLGFKKSGKPDDGAKPPAATDSEVVAGFVAVRVFIAGLERRNGVLLQSGRALRRINKLLGTELRGASSPQVPHFQLPVSPWMPRKPLPSRGFSTESINAYLNLLAGAYTKEQTEATLMIGFYTRDGRWRFADTETARQIPASSSEVRRT